MKNIPDLKFIDLEDVLYRKSKMKMQFAKRASQFLLENFFKINPQKRKSAKEILSSQALIHETVQNNSHIYLGKNEFWKSQILDKYPLAFTEGWSEIHSHKLRVEAIENIFEDPIKNGKFNERAFFAQSLKIEDDEKNLAGVEDFSQIEESSSSNIGKISI